MTRTAGRQLVGRPGALVGERGRCAHAQDLLRLRSPLLQGWAPDEVAALEAEAVERIGADQELDPECLALAEAMLDDPDTCRALGVAHVPGERVFQG